MGMAREIRPLKGRLEADIGLRKGRSSPARRSAERRASAARRRAERAPSPEPAAPGRRLSPGLSARRRRVAFRLTVVACVWSVGLVIAALVLPVYRGETISNTSGVTLTTTTLVSVNGPWVLIPVAIPFVLCVVVGIALSRKWSHGVRRSGGVAWLAIGLLAAFALLSIASIGVFIVPVAILLACAASLTGVASRGPVGHPAGLASIGE